jgi:hypothetical protein
MDSDQTCLHIAAGFSDALPLAEHEAIVTLLLDCGANPRAYDETQPQVATV